MRTYTCIFSVCLFPSKHSRQQNFIMQTISQKREKICSKSTTTTFDGIVFYGVGCGWYNDDDHDDSDGMRLVSFPRQQLCIKYSSNAFILAHHYHHAPPYQAKRPCSFVCFFLHGRKKEQIDLVPSWVVGCLFGCVMMKQEKQEG